MAAPASELSEESKILLESLGKLGLKPYTEYDDVVEARQAGALGSGLFSYLCGEYDQQGSRTEIFIPSPDIADGIPVYIYKPKKLQKDPPIVVYYHGGGWVLGSRGTSDIACQVISDLGGFIIVNVEYRLAPEHKYPACVEDALCAATWVMKNQDQVGGSSNSRVGVAGDSAGGSLAASVSHDLPGIAFQILVYMRADLNDFTMPSMKQFGDGPILTIPLLKWFNERLWPSEDFNDARLSCILRDQFDHLPPALFIVADCDAIRDDSLEYQKKLNDAGVATELVLMKGSVHAFFGWRGFFPEATKEPYIRCASFVNKYGKMQ